VAHPNTRKRKTRPFLFRTRFIASVLSLAFLMVFGVFKLRCNVFVAGTFVTLCSTMNTALDVFEEELTRKQSVVEQSVVEQDDEEHIFDVSIPSFLQKTGYVRRDFDFAKKFDPKHFQLVVKKGDSASTRVSVHEGPTLKDVIVAGTTLEILGEAFDVGPPPLLNQNHVFLIQNCNVETQCHFFSRFKLATLHRGPDEGSHATVSAGQRKRWEEGGFHGYRPILFSEEKSQPPTG